MNDNNDAFSLRISESLDELSLLLKRVQENCNGPIEEFCHTLCETYEKGGKLIACGNGGSAADAQHIVAELVGRFLIAKRPALAAVSLSCNPSLVTAAANDYGYDNVFSRQMEGLAGPFDTVLGISTSGNSENVIRAIKVARDRKAKTVALLGGDGGKLATLVDTAIIIPTKNTPRIQECHITIGHIVCDLVESTLFPQDKGQE